MSQSNSLSTSAPTGSSIYALLRNSSVQIWNNTYSQWQTWEDGNYSQYLITLVEQGTSGFFYASVPSGISQNGQLSVEFYSGSGYETDQLIAGGSFFFAGSEPVCPQQCGTPPSCSTGNWSDISDLLDRSFSLYTGGQTIGAGGNITVAPVLVTADVPASIQPLSGKDLLLFGKTIGDANTYFICLTDLDVQNGDIIVDDLGFRFLITYTENVSVITGRYVAIYARKLIE
jgi:hypothetical protein